MKIVVVGGRLQGVEAVYLARKAGLETVLIDRNPDVPAAGLCDEFLLLDVEADSEKAVRKIKNAGLIIPALENKKALSSLERIAGAAGIPLAFDAPSYSVSSSKVKSDNVFRENGIPAPEYWPVASLPVIVKPSGASGSKGVLKIDELRNLTGYLEMAASDPEGWVIQEYLPGPSYSIEVMGSRGNYVSFQVTGLEMDENYDCKRVLAPVNIDCRLEREFRGMAEKIADAINLRGIMDVEVINHGGVLKVLEIDARLPSQTPAAVYKSSGINMLEWLYKFYTGGALPVMQESAGARAVVYEHVRVTRERIETLGEHVMAAAGPLRLYDNMWGADEVITDFSPGRRSWVATLIVTGSGPEEAWVRRCETIDWIMKKFGLREYIDSAPGDPKPSGSGENPAAGNEVLT